MIQFENLSVAFQRFVEVFHFVVGPGDLYAVLRADVGVVAEERIIGLRVIAFPGIVPAV